MKLTRYVVAVVLVLVAPVPVRAADLTVLTRNLYLGADLLPVALAPTPAEFLAAAEAVLAQIAANNFPERAAALAEEIAERRPHLVGLQEVYDFTLDGANGAPPFRDHLVDLLAALAAHGADYEVAAMVRNMDLAVTLPGIGEVRVVDRDVILRRTDVQAAVVPLPCARVSADGCNFAFAASLPSPVGAIPFERGYVAVSAVVDGRAFVVVNTHLELRIPAFPTLAVIQSLQAQELVAVAGALQGVAPVLVLGDMNSAPEHEVLLVEVAPDVFVPAVPPYAQFLAASYADAWELRPGKSPGLTCCQAADLSNRRPMLTERIDLIFSSAPPLDVKANVLGNVPADKTRPSRLWPSDHAGVVATLEIAP